MDEYAGRVLAGRYRLPRPPADEFEPVETRAFDTYSGQEVLVRQLLLPEIVHADGDDDGPGGGTHAGDPAQRALQAAQAAAAVPDHPRLVQVFDVLIEGGSLWVVSELVPGSPVAALLVEARFSPYRAAEIASDLLAGLRALHAYGWAHRNVTVHTVLVCDDGRAMLDGLAFGAAQEALCGYDPVPEEVLAASGGNGGAEQRGWGGPDSALTMERARQTRIGVVGPVTERWAPEQAAGPVPGNWQLAPPVGPTADLWALGALLFRCVQGHAAFPEESSGELVRLVCAEPPAYAEDCGPLRPVVESLLRQDPQERPGTEELQGWLRSLVRSAPEPGIGIRTIAMPSGYPTDPHGLPVVRRKGELVKQRKRREKAARAAQAAQAAEARAAESSHRRHARARSVAPSGERPRALAPAAPPSSLDAVGLRAKAADPRGTGRGGQSQRDATPPQRRGPRRLGLLLVVLIFVALVALVLYAMLLMPHQKTGAHSLPASVSSGDSGGTGTAASPSTTATAPASGGHTSPPASASPPAKPPTAALGADFAVRHDPAGFSVAVHKGWTRSAGPKGETVFSSSGGVFRLIVVRGRDAAASFGGDPVGYETLQEPELSGFYASTWTSSSTKTLVVNGDPAAEGGFSWRDPHSGTELYASNLAVLRGGRYDIVMLVGPYSQRQVTADYFAKSAETFRVGG